MTPKGITVVLTLLAAVVVVLTRLRMARHGDNGGAAGRAAISMLTLNVHTSAGTIALVLWSIYLYMTQLVVGWIAIGFWWVTTIAGLMLLARWLPARGRHSIGPIADTWGEGPGLSILAHVGLLVGSIIFTVFLGAGSI